MVSISDLIPWDSEVGGGAGGIRIQVPEFERAFQVHDAWYDDLKAGTATKTLKQIDREFFRNMMRAALGAEGTARKVQLMRRAWLFYRFVRMWAKVVRPELDRFVPGGRQ